MYAAKLYQERKVIKSVLLTQWKMNSDLYALLLPISQDMSPSYTALLWLKR